MPRRLSTVIPFPFKTISSLSNVFHCGIILTVFFCKCVLTQIMQSKCIYLWSTTELELLDVVACSSNSVHTFLPYLVPFLNKSLQAYFCFFLCSSHGLVSRCPHSVFRDISALWLFLCKLNMLSRCQLGIYPDLRLWGSNILIAVFKLWVQTFVWFTILLKVGPSLDFELEMGLYRKGVTNVLPFETDTKESLCLSAT